MGRKESHNEGKDCICRALFELRELQDFITQSNTPFFGNLLYRLVGTDTIPFFLLTKNGMLKLSGIDHNRKNGKEHCFITSFFRIEKIDKDSCCAFISLLRPLDIDGHFTDSLCDVMILEKTSTCVEVDLTNICAIQPVDIDLLKRCIIIEPKW